MYGLKEAAILDSYQKQDHLEKWLAPFKHTPGMWRHKAHNLTFTLGLDDFGIK